MHFAFTNIRALNDGLQIKAIICNLMIIIVVFDVILKFTKNSRWTPSLRDYLLALCYYKCNTFNSLPAQCSVFHDIQYFASL